MISVYVEIVLATIMIVAGIFKMFSFSKFTDTLKRLGVYLPKLGATFTIALELLSGVAVFIDDTRYIGEIGFLILICLFSLSIYLASRKKNKIECNCFGGLLPSYFDLNLSIRLLVMFLLTIYILFSDNTFQMSDLYYLDIICIVLMTMSLFLLNMFIQALIDYRATRKKIGENDHV